MNTLPDVVSSLRQQLAQMSSYLLDAATAVRTSFPSDPRTTFLLTWAQTCATACDTVSSSLEGVQSLAEAMAADPAMLQDWSMTLTVFNVFLNQMTGYHQDSLRCCEVAKKELILQRSGPQAAAAAASPVSPVKPSNNSSRKESSYPPAPTIAVVSPSSPYSAAPSRRSSSAESNRSAAAAVPSLDRPREGHESDGDEAPTSSVAPKKKKSKKSKTHTEDEERVVEDSNPFPSVENRGGDLLAPPLKKKKKKSKKHEDADSEDQRSTGALTPRAASFNLVGENRSVATPTVATPTATTPRRQSSVMDMQPASFPALPQGGGGASLYNPPNSNNSNLEEGGAIVMDHETAVSMAWEPQYVPVVAKVHQSLAPVFVSCLPTGFADVEDMIREGAVTQSYHVALRPEGCLASLFVKCWLHIDPQDQEDFLADVLESDHVEAEPFRFIADDIEVHRPEEVGEEELSSVSALPACGLRKVSCDVESRFWYTQYAFVSAPALLQYPKALLIHEMHVDKKQRQQLLHVIAPVEKAPQYAIVKSYCYSAKGKALEHVDAAAAMTKELLDRCGFVTVDDSEVAAAQERVNAAVKQDALTKRHKKEADAEAERVSSVALVQEKKKESASSKVLGFGLGIGKSLVMAPMTVTKAVSSAVVNATENVLLSQVHEKFPVWFPDLKDEEIVESFNCALVEGTVVKQGILVATSGWLCFHATLLSASFAVEFEDVQEIKKAKTAKIFDNAIEVHMFDGRVFFLSSFMQRDQSFKTLHGIWSSSGSLR